jgi:hypothetical protein
LALAASLLLHLILFGGLKDLLPRWQLPADPPALEVRLAAVPKPQAAPDPPPPRKPPATPVVRRPAVPPVEPAGETALPEAIEPGLATTETVEEAGPDDRGEPPAAAGSATDVPAVDVSVAEPAPLPLNPLPPRLDLGYRLRYGIAQGEQTLVWINEGERYTLTSVASATGIAGIFYRGKFVQTSRGRITSHGLQPEEFWDQRGDKRSSARFDASQGLLTLQPATGEPRHFAYQEGVQDALSLFFQMALTAPPPDGRFSHTVFNGKKLRTYTYEVRGEVMQDTALGTLRTLHLARQMNSDGRFEVWLAIDRHYLPVRMLRSDEDGNEMELSVRSIAP